MRRRLSQTRSADLEAAQGARAGCIQGVIDSVKDRMTFMELAELLDVSHEYVRSRLTRNPELLLFVGKSYRVPRDVGVAFVTEVLSQPLRRSARSEALQPKDTTSTAA
jgi:hypothetical protein